MAGNVRPPKYGKHYSRRKVEEVIDVIVSKNPTIDKLAEITGVCERTIHRWYKDDSFIERLRIARHNVYEPGYIVLRQEFKNTVLALVKLRDDLTESGPVRLGAMRTLMEYGRMVDITDYYEEKLKTLESKTIDAVPVTNAIAVSEPTAEWVSNDNDWYSDEPSNTPN